VYDQCLYTVRVMYYMSVWSMFVYSPCNVLYECLIMVCIQSV